MDETNGKIDCGNGASAEGARKSPMYIGKNKSRGCIMPICIAKRRFTFDSLSRLLRLRCLHAPACTALCYESQRIEPETVEKRLSSLNYLQTRAPPAERKTGISEKSNERTRIARRVFESANI